MRRRVTFQGHVPDPSYPAGYHLGGPIEHVVVLMMSGHSYDNFFGMLEGRGDGYPRDAQGVAVATSAGVPVRAFHMPTTGQEPRPDGGIWTASHIQSSGKNTGSVRALEQLEPGSKSVTWPMGFWTEEDLPFYYGLARTFPLAARWFSSCLGPGLPNRRFLVAGTAYGSVGDRRIENGGRPANGTIFDQLDRNRVTWANYFFPSAVKVNIPLPPGLRLIAQRPGLFPVAHLVAQLDQATDWVTRRLPPLLRRILGTVTCTAGVYQLNVRARSRNLHEIDRFFDDASRGRLPSVCIVDPDFAVNSGEAPQDVTLSEQFAWQVVNAVMGGPDWPRTLLIWLHDYHGLYYDHVEPPPASVLGDDVRPRLMFDQDRVAGYATYDTLGYRVPAVVVSPYARPDYVSYFPYDHCSILKLIERVWNLPPLTPRDADAIDPLHMLDFDSPPHFLVPPVLPRPSSARPWTYLNPFRVQSLGSLARACLTVAIGWSVGFWAFRSGKAWIEIAIVAAICALTVRLVSITRFWRKWIFWRVYKDEPTGRAAVYATVVALLSLTTLFALVSALLYRLGPFRASPTPGNASLWRYTLSYIWNAVDAVPALRLTDTFNWTAGISFLDPWSRLFVIIYRLLVLAPVVQLVVELLQRNDKSATRQFDGPREGVADAAAGNDVPGRPARWPSASQHPPESISLNIDYDDVESELDNKEAEVDSADE